MREIHRSAIVPYTPDAMYALVADVEAYPAFLPGCVASAVKSRTEDSMEASLSLAKGPFAASFTTRNALDRPERMTMELVEGPFRSLYGEWQFAPLGDEGCRVDLRLRFELPAARDLLFGHAFEVTLGGLVDAFVKRAHATYG